MAPVRAPKRSPPASTRCTPCPCDCGAPSSGPSTCSTPSRGRCDKPTSSAAQALADVATIAILQHRATIEAQAVNEQLNHALNSRIVIEQAKGMLAERAGLDMEQAFATLRNHARNHNLRLVDVAHDLIDGTLAASALDRPPFAKST